MERTATIAEKHNLFKISSLNRWLRFKEPELEMVTKMGSVNGIAFLADKSHLEKELADSFSFFDKKFALVLNVPPLEEKTIEMLNFRLMKDYVDGRLMLGEEEDEDSDEDGLPWHMEARKAKRKHVLDKIRKMAEHVEKNKQIKKQVQFFVPVSEENGKKFGCRYSVYYKADNLQKDNVDQLPIPPILTGLRIQLDAGRTKKPSIRLKLDYEDLGFPACTFLTFLEFRPKDDFNEDWKQQKTSNPGEKQTVIALRKDSCIELRVAAETCIGRSEVSEVSEFQLMEESFVAAADRPTSGLKPNFQRAQLPVVEDGAGPPSAPKMEPSEKRIVWHPPTKLEVEFETQTTAELV